MTRRMVLPSPRPPPPPHDERLLEWKQPDSSREGGAKVASPEKSGPHAASTPTDQAKEEADVATKADTVLLFSRLASPFFLEHHVQRRAVWLRSVGLICMSFCNTGLFVAFSYLERDFSTALSSKDTSAFYTAASRIFLLVLGIAPAFAWFSFSIAAYKLHWREWMTKRLLKRYFSRSAYYHIGASIDNPDQRLTEDVKAFVARESANRSV